MAKKSTGTLSMKVHVSRRHITGYKSFKTPYGDNALTAAEMAAIEATGLPVTVNRERMYVDVYDGEGRLEPLYSSPSPRSVARSVARSMKGKSYKPFTFILRV